MVNMFEKTFVVCDQPGPETVWNKMSSAFVIPKNRWSQHDKIIKAEVPKSLKLKF